MTDITVAMDGKAFGPLRSAPSMRIVIPGGDGHLGQLLVRHLSMAGHEVIALTRQARSSRNTNAQTKSVVWDGRNLGAWVEALSGADVLINLAGRSVDCRYNAGNREEILRSRVESTTVLGRAIQSLRRAPRLWLNASTATIYRHALDRDMDEATGELGGREAGAPLKWGFSIKVAREWEQALRNARTSGTRKVALRTAMVMSVGPGGVFEVVLGLVRRGLGGKWGSGRQYMSWIHQDDFVRAVEFLIEQENVEGAVNLAAPHPLPNDEFLTQLRQAWGIRIGLPASEWMLELAAVLWRTETELLLKSRRVVPGVLRNHGFEFRFATWLEAAHNLVERWREKDSRNSIGEKEIKVSEVIG